MAGEFDPYHLWLGIGPQERPLTHYRLLGIPLFETDPAVIEIAADRQMGHLRTFQGSKQAAFCQRLLNEVAFARVCLLNPARKADYDRELRESMGLAAATGFAPATETAPPVALRWNSEIADLVSEITAEDAVYDAPALIPETAHRGGVHVRMGPLIATVISVLVIVVVSEMSWTCSPRSEKSEKAEDSPRSRPQAPPSNATPSSLVPASKSWPSPLTTASTRGETPVSAKKTARGEQRLLRTSATPSASEPLMPLTSTQPEP